MDSFKVAIDGPAGSGKSTISKKVCDLLGFTHIDTGAMYRAVTLEALNRGIDLENSEEYSFLDDVSIRYENNKIFLNGKSVGREIRSTRVADNVSTVAKMPVVRYKMVELQQKAAQTGKIVMDGRDIGYVVLPDADVKIFLTASVEERAKRRFKENQLAGREEKFEDILENIKSRDFLDSNREINPLRQAADAILLDTTTMTIDEVIAEIVRIIKERVS
jgi:cytidylate kinase